MCRAPNSGGCGDATGVNAELANTFTALAAHYKGAACLSHIRTTLDLPLPHDLHVTVSISNR